MSLTLKCPGSHVCGFIVEPSFKRNFSLKSCQAAPYLHSWPSAWFILFFFRKKGGAVSRANSCKCLHSFRLFFSLYDQHLFWCRSLMVLHTKEHTLAHTQAFGSWWSFQSWISRLTVCFLLVIASPLSGRVLCGGFFVSPLLQSACLLWLNGSREADEGRAVRLLDQGNVAVHTGVEGIVGEWAELCR